MHILMTMLPESQRMHAAFVAAFPDYVTGVFAGRGYPLDRPSVEAIGRAAAILDAELAVEMDRPFVDQRRSPLEIFRTALGLVAESLEERGVVPAESDARQRDGDLYGLAPGSSSALGSEAHESHLAWGTAKAAAFARTRSPSRGEPVVLLMCGDRTEQAGLVEDLGTPGIRCVAVRNPGAVAEAINRGGAIAAAVDLSHRSARDAIGRLADARIPIVAYGDTPEDLLVTGLRAAGVRSVVERAEFLADPGRFLPTVA
jgi:hypothetical protein